MKLAILVALCSGIAFAKLRQQGQTSQELYQQLRNQKQIHETKFKQGIEYQYLYNGQIMTGIPGSSRQHAGTRMKAVVLMQFKGAEQVFLKLTNVRFGKLNSDISDPRRTQPFSLFEEVPLEQHLEQKLEKPVRFEYTNGMIRDIHWEDGDQPWSVNIKRGVLNMLQVNLKQHHRVNTEEQQLVNHIQTQSGEVQQGQNRYFRAMEKTLEGECETIYEIGRRPSMEGTNNVPVLNVTKSIDFETCQKRPQIKYNWRFSENCPTCEKKYQDDEKFLKSSVVFKYNITGNVDQFMIESTEVESQYSFVPLQETDSIVNTYIKQKLELARTIAIQRELTIATPIRSDSQMVYTVDWDISKEKFFMAGEEQFHQKTPYSAATDKVHIISEIVRQLVTSIDEKVNEEAPHHFSRLVTMFRLASRQELEQIHASLVEGQQQNSFTPEEQRKMKDLVLHAIALSGTNSAVAHVVQKIKERRISPLTASIVVRQLQNVRVVSEQMIQQLKSLTKEPMVQEHHQLKQAVWLTLGSLANAICSENDDQLAVEQQMRAEQLCSKQLKEQLVKAFFDELKQAQKWEDQLLLLKAIRNAGIDMSVQQLEKIIAQRERQWPAFVRSNAILALENLRQQMPRKVRQLLMPVYMNPRERPEVRMAAVHEILSTQPERPILEIIAKNLNTEPSRQVASFVYSYLQTLANSTNPCLQNMTTDLKLALRFTREINPGIQYSKAFHLPVHSTQQNIGFDLNMYNVMTNRSLIPYRTSMSLDTNFLGMWSRYFATVGVTAEGIEPLVYQLLGENGLFSEGVLQDFIWQRNSRQSQKPYQEEMQQLFNTLKIRSRDFTHEPKLFVDLKLKGQEVGFLPLSKDIVTELLQQATVNFKQAEQQLRQGVQVNVNKATILRELSFKIPTTIGLPLLWKLKVPAVLSVRGKVQLQTEAGLKKIVLSGDLKPSLAIAAVQSMEVWSPVVNSGIKIRMEARAFAPIRGQIHAQLNESPKQLKLIVEPPKTPKELLVLETKPVTFTFTWPKSLSSWKEAEEKTIRGEEWNRVETIDQSYGRKVAGVELKVRGRWHKMPARRVPGTPLVPLSGPNKLVVQIQPGMNQPEEIEFKLEGFLNKHTEQKFMSELNTKKMDMFPGDSSSSESVSASSESQSQEKQQQQHKQQQQQRKFKYQQRSNSRQSSKSAQDSSEESFEAQPQGTTRQNQLVLEVTARGAVKRHVIMTATHQFTPDMRYNGIKAQLKCSAVPQLQIEPCNIVLNAEAVYPKTPFHPQETLTKKVVGQVQLKWTQQQSQDGYITMKVQAERSQAQKQWEQKQRQQRDECQFYEQKKLSSPVACAEKVAELAMLKKYTVDIDYQHVPAQLKNVTNQLLQYLKYRYYWQTDIASLNVQNVHNKIQAKIYLDPETNQHINITMRMPMENVTMQNIPLPVRISPMNTRRSMLTQYLYDITNEKYQTRAMCQITDRRVRTFDGSRYALPLSTCYSVLAKDCVQNSRFAVLIKKLTHESQHKQLKIVTPQHQIVLKPETGSKQQQQMRVEINGQQININNVHIVQEHGHEVAVIERRAGQQQIYVELPEAGIEVHFDGYAANVQISPLYMYRQCGLCGHYDSEPGFGNEFMTPTFERAANIRSFFQGYTLSDNQCQMSSGIEKHKWQWQSKESSEESSEESRSSSSQSSSSSESSQQSSEESNSKTESKSSSSESKSTQNSKSSQSSSSSESREDKINFNYQRKQQKPVLKTKVIQHLGKTCFSMQKLPKCPRGTYPTKFEQQTREIEYRCVRNGDSAWMNSFEKSTSSELNSKSTESMKSINKHQLPEHIRQSNIQFQQRERIPKSCQK